MLRQLNVKRQLTIPARLAKRLGLSSKSWVDVSEGRGVLIISPANIEAQQAKSLDMTDDEWRAFNRKVQGELKGGTGAVHDSPEAFLSDLKRRIRK